MINFFADCLAIAGKNLIGFILIAVTAIVGMTLVDELRRRIRRR